MPPESPGTSGAETPEGADLAPASTDPAGVFPARGSDAFPDGEFAGPTSGQATQRAAAEAAPAAPRVPRAFHVQVDEAGIADVVFDVPGRSVNTFDAQVLDELEAVAAELAADERVRAVVLRSGKEKGFAAGADVDEIAAVVDPDDARRKVVRGQRAFQRVAELKVPTLAAIHGACLGGGLELALACSHRIAALDARLSFPEVNLGIFPAWGGSQRLPRLIGVASAVELLATGRPVDGKRALRIRLVDRASPPGELRERAFEFARELTRGEGPRQGRRTASNGAGPQGTSRLQRLALESNPVGRKLVFRQARKRIVEKTHGHYPAPLRGLQAMEEGLDGSLEAGFALEARLVTDLLVSPVSKNLLHVHRLFESVKKSPWIAAPPDERPVERAGIVGAGVMGGAIARLLAEAGVWVRMKDLEATRVADGLRAARQGLERRARRDRTSAVAVRRAMSRIAGGTTWAGFGRADVVVEAVVEDLDVKQHVFGELERAAAPETILCSNTSSLPIARIAGGVRDRSRVAGLHFFNPVDRMPLVEIVRAPETSEATVGRLYRLAVRLEKKPVVVRDAPGFLVNRLLMPYLNEAAHLLESGATVEEIDRVMTVFGMPVGPFALLDDVGLDVAYKAGVLLADAFPNRMEPAPLFARLNGLGRTGRKGGRGFYLYQGTSRKGVDPQLREELGRDRKDTSTVDVIEIERRLVYPMVDEAARCLAEAVVSTPEEVDLAMIAGTGFPPFRGGLLRHADAVGVGAIVASLERLSVSVSPRLAPSRALRDVAGLGGFYQPGAAA